MLTINNSKSSFQFRFVLSDMQQANAETPRFAEKRFYSERSQERTRQDGRTSLRLAIPKPQGIYETKIKRLGCQKCGEHRRYGKGDQ